MKAKRKIILRKRALKIKQNSEHPLSMFSLTGSELLKIAEISRIELVDLLNID